MNTPQPPVTDEVRAEIARRATINTVHRIAAAVRVPAPQVRAIAEDMGMEYDRGTDRMRPGGPPQPPPSARVTAEPLTADATPSQLAAIRERLFGRDYDPDPADLDWKLRGLCGQTDPEAFFPEKGGSTREAKRVCRSCEVRSECLEFALEHDERFGIWGGLSERERRKLRRRAG